MRTHPQRLLERTRSTCERLIASITTGDDPRPNVRFFSELGLSHPNCEGAYSALIDEQSVFVNDGQMPSEEHLTTRARPICVHELGHFFTEPKPVHWQAEDRETDDGIRHLVTRHAEVTKDVIGTQQWWAETHTDSWHRVVAHLTWRAQKRGCRFTAQALSAEPCVVQVAQSLEAECIAHQRTSIKDILATEPPQRFTELMEARHASSDKS